MNTIYVEVNHAGGHYFIGRPSRHEKNYHAAVFNFKIGHFEPSKETFRTATEAIEATAKIAMKHEEVETKEQEEISTEEEQEVLAEAVVEMVEEVLKERSSRENES